MVICLERGADCLHMVKLVPKTPSSLASFKHLNPYWFYLSGTDLTRLSWKRGRQTGVVVVVIAAAAAAAAVIAKPHRCAHNKMQPTVTVAAWSVCLAVGHERELC